MLLKKNSEAVLPVDGIFFPLNYMVDEKPDDQSILPKEEPDAAQKEND